MLQISSIELAFDSKTLYHITTAIEKQSTHILSQKIEAVVIYHAFTEELPAGLKTTANRIIQACKIDLNRSLFLNAAFEQITLGNLQNRHNPKLVLVFGDIPISKNIPKLLKNHTYQVSGTTIIRTETLENLENKKGEKSALWSVLQSTLNTI